VVTGRLYTVAGTGVAGFSGDRGPADRAELDAPAGVGVDPAGDLFIADTANCRVREVAAGPAARSWVGPIAPGAIETVAGSGVCGTPAGAGQDGDGGTATGAIVWGPVAVAVDPRGDLLIADRGDDEVREVAAASGTFFGVPIAGGHIATVAGTGTGYGPYLIDGLPATGETAGINDPQGVALTPGGDLVIADGADQAVREVFARPGETAGHPEAVGDMGTVMGALLAGPDQDGTRWVTGRVDEPWGVAVLGDELLFSDRGGDVVRRVALPGSLR
jgi:hypothetical protein